MKPAPLAALIALAALSACRTVGPNYVRPTAPQPPAWAEAPPANWNVALPAESMLGGTWWQIFGDAGLNQLEPRVQVSNQSLLAAQAAYLQARTLVAYYRADRMPTVTVGPGVAPAREPADRPLATSPTAPVTYNDFVLPFDVSWEPDVWGRVTREVEQQRDLAQASASDLAGMQLSLQAELAVDYFQERSTEAEIRLLDDTVAADQTALQLTENRHAGGVVSDVDVAQAQTELESTRAQAQDAGIARAQLTHAIAVLLGVPPASFTLPPGSLADQPPAIPIGVPAQLLQRRPDIAAAERRVAAANAAIGLARSAFYPLIQLSADAGVESTAAGNLFTLPNTFWSLGAAALETVYEGGHRRALAQSAVDAYDQQVADYRQTVLTAFQEVEDNLAALRLLADEAATEQAAVAAAQRSLTLSTNRYQGGVTTYLEVTTAQTAALQNERAGVQIQGERFAASVLLIKALGGGWDATALPSTAPVPEPGAPRP